MAQVTQGLRSILSTSAAYDAFQNLVGADAFRRTIVAEYLSVAPGRSLLDIGCGTAAILSHLPPGVAYVGFDASEEYIRGARIRFGDRGRFFAQRVSDASLSGLPKFDLVLAIGLVHHLDDPEARQLFALAGRALNPDGRFLTVDPCLEPGQNRIARAIIGRDRGQNVRSLEAYRKLAVPCFAIVESTLRHDLLRIPYTHAILSCSAPRSSPVD